jgi:hypothetical protein
MVAKTLKHKKTSAIGDTGDSSFVRPSDWNSDHDLWLGSRTVATATDTMLNADHLAHVQYNNAGGVAVTLPQAGAGGNFISGWTTHIRNVGAGTVTITPTTSTINGAATLVLRTKQAAFIYSDGINYSAIVTEDPTAVHPSFSAHRNNVAQAGVVTAVETKVLFTHELFDNGACFTPGATSRFQPAVPGKYLIVFSVLYPTVVDGTYVEAIIYKNGTPTFYGPISPVGFAGPPITQISAIVDMNGSTDYCEFYTVHNNGTTLALGGAQNSTYVMACWMGS